MMSCLCHANVKHTMMMWCSGNVNTNDIMPTHSYMAQMECKCQCHHDGDVHINSNPSDITSGMHSMYVYGTCALSEIGMSKYSSDLACIQADLNLT